MIVDSIEEYQQLLADAPPLMRLAQAVHDLRNCTNTIMAIGQMLVNGDPATAEQERSDNSRLLREARSIAMILSALIEDERIHAALAQDDANQQGQSLITKIDQT